MKRIKQVKHFATDRWNQAKTKLNELVDQDKSGPKPPVQFELDGDTYERLSQISVIKHTDPHTLIKRAIAQLIEQANELEIPISDERKLNNPLLKLDAITKEVNFDGASPTLPNE